MDSSLQPPLIADILTYLLIIALFYLVYYSYNLRKEILNQKFELLLPPPNPVNNKKSPEPPTNSPGKFRFYIEPSPIPDQQVLFPSIFSYSELFLSIIVPVQNMEEKVINTLEKIQIYFSNMRENNSNFTYEIIVVDMSSTDGTYSVVYEYALQNPEIRILKIPFDISLNFSLVISATRIRGRLLFIYIPKENLPIQIFSKLLNKIKASKSKRDANEIVVFPCLVDFNSSQTFGVANNYEQIDETSFNENHYQTLLSQFVDYISSKFLSASTQIKSKTFFHFRSILMTREAARIIFTNIKLSGEWFDQELAYIAAKENMVIKRAVVDPGESYAAVYDVPSWERIYRLLDLLQCSLLYSTGIWKINKKTT